MSLEQVPGTDLSYFLIAFDLNGKERTDDPEGLMSDRIKNALRNDGITDVFLISHGWNGDVPAARQQYGNWIRAMHNCREDRDRIRQVRPHFRPLLIGVHWPSLAWGDESLGGPVSFSPSEPDPIESTVDAYARSLANTERARQALRIILIAARDEPPPEQLPPDILAAYKVLDEETGLGDKGEGAKPGDDRENFDPQAIFEEGKGDEVSFGLFDSASWLTPLRTLSFWQMKARACHVGEHGAGDFFIELLRLADPAVRFHLMGHSFGSIVVSALISGKAGRGPLPRPVNSLTLVQGALSLWSFCSAIPASPSRTGYFRRIIDERRVQGPILTTMSSHDLALGNWYGWGAWSGGQIEFAPGQLPKYGAVGSWGVRGPGVDLVELDMLAADGAYTLEPFKVYNLESSNVINKREGSAGAHNDIAKPQVAHALWSAAIGG